MLLSGERINAQYQHRGRYTKGFRATVDMSWFLLP
jgi:hypothetical protein